MSILPRRTSTRLALVLGVVVAVAAIVVLSFVLRDGDVPAPTDGIGDLPTAHLVPEDVALYVGLSTDLDAKSWLGAFALLERLGVEDPLGKVREGLEGEGETDVGWDEEIEPFLGGAAVLARSFARIHESNLKKQGLLALTFINFDDYERIREDDRISLTGLRDMAPGKPVQCTVSHSDGTSETLELQHSYSESQLEWFRLGSALNLFHQQPKGSPERYISTA